MRKRNRKLSPFLGFIIFLIGTGGIWHYYWELRTEKLENFFPADVPVFAKFQINESKIEDLKTLFPQTDFFTLLNVTLFPDLQLANFEENILSWIGSEIGVSFLDDNNFFIGIEMKSKDNAQDFIKNFLAEGESFKTNIVNEIEIWMPEYSSSIAFGFHGRWLLVSSSSHTIENVFSSEIKLKDNVEYNNISNDLPKDSFFSFYIDTNKTTQLFKGSKYVTFKPLVEAISQTLPIIGMSADIEKKGIDIDTKFIADKNVFNPQKVKRDPNILMPKLAQFGSRDVLFFINGIDLYEKYKHTSNFLSQMNPQFSLIFEGLVRAKFYSIFGEDFDFESEFLALTHGQYAIMVDYRDELYPFLQFTFISEFGESDIEHNLSKFHEAVRLAQSQFTTKVEEVELPDGTLRKELVSVPREDIPIQEVAYSNEKYYTVENQVPDKKFSYGFVENYFVFSTHEEGIIGVINNKNNINPNLSENEDFRESVLFNYSPSESYGFVNLAKMTSTLEFLYSAKETSTVGHFLKTNLRTATFARKVFPEEMFLSAFLFAR